MAEELLAIREAAEKLGVETHALRYWEEELELPVERNAQGRRMYTPQNMDVFRQIMKWKAEGMALKEMKPLLGTHTQETVTDKSKRLQELLKQFIADTIKESKEELIRGVKEALVKELDYQFRLQEEREEEREKARTEKEDRHFKRLDENLRSVMEKKQRKRYF